jgi:EAL domain-containing protein (putative c-di-GMP-specific phosphodiesterase class I)/CheY-like chemotaxis protein
LSPALHARDKDTGTERQFPGIDGGGRRVLVVDDDSVLREMLVELLTDAGYQVTACPDGRTALAALEREPPDAVVSDVQMPDMDGLALLKAVRARDLDVPVVLCTGGPSLETAIEAVERGALKYLIRPVPAERMLEAVGRAVTLGRLARLKRKALESAGFAEEMREREALDARFEAALGALWMAMQPIVRTSDRKVVAYELLVRTAERTFPNPFTLLGAAERLGRLVELGRAIRARVAGMMATTLPAGDVFVNLHPKDLGDDSLIDPEAPLSRWASRVVLEITERASLDDVPDVPARVGSLRRLGYRIAIDDLGAGYAGLTSFAALAPEMVKLDMSLIRGIERDPVRQKLVASMYALCRELGTTVVAEGVETEAELEAVQKTGCPLVQGFLFGRPSGTRAPE